MPDLSVIARNLAQTGLTQRLVIADDGIAKKNSSFWHPLDARTENKAQFKKFYGILKSDPSLHFGDAADAAFAAIRKEAAKGQPLTARLMAKAFAAGDTAVARFHDEKAAQREHLLQRTMALVRGNDLLDLAVRRFTKGEINRLSQSAAPAALKEIKALVIDELRRKTAELADDSLGNSRLSDLEHLIHTATNEQMEAIRRLAAQPGEQFLSLQSNDAPQRLQSTLAMVREAGEKRTQATFFASAGANALFEQEVLRDMESRFQAMDNRTLLDLYRTTLSADMVELRLKLANRPDDPVAQRALADLNSWEGMVHMAVAERALSPNDASRQPVGDLRPLTGTQLATLAQVEKSAANRDLNWQSDAYLQGTTTVRTADPGATQMLRERGVTLGQVETLLKQSDLTVNIGAGLFKRNGPMIDENGQVREGARLKNIFDLPDNIKGPLYKERRRLVEQNEMPTLARQDRQGVDSANHPISAALNPARRMAGAAVGNGYGEVVLVLKDDVKQRATYTPTDSFRAYEARLTKESVAAMKGDIAILQRDIAILQRDYDVKLSESALRQLREEPGTIITPLFERLDNHIDSAFGLGHATSLDEFVHKTLAKDLPGFEGEDKEILNDFLINMAIRHFIDRSPGTNHVTSFDHLAQVIGKVNQDPEDRSDRLGWLATGAQDPQRVNLRMNGYIEAQIFGGVDLSRDVKEIRYPRGLVGDNPDEGPEIEKALRTLAQTYGIPVKDFEVSEATISRLGTDESIKANFHALPQDITDLQVSSLTAFRKQHLSRILDQYKAHEQNFDPTGINGRRHISRALVYANVLANFFRLQGAPVNSDVLYTAVGCHDAGRKGNGIDRCEKDSAIVATQHYDDRGITNQSFLKKVGDCINSQPAGSVKTLEGAILKSVDSMDIMRVHGRENYRTELLWFMNTDARVGNDPGQEKYVMANHDLRDQMLNEVHAFIQATEPQSPSDRKLREVERQFEAALLSGQDVLLEELQATKRELAQKVIWEHKTYNSLTSDQVFAAIETELTSNKAKYPLLNSLYDPDKL